MSETKLDVIAIREYLHTIPELGFKEFKTSAYLADELEKLGYEVTRNLGGATGVMGVIRGSEPGPVVLLRADMDALPFKDPDGTVVNVHACGHDAHSAMLLTAAAELVGKVRRGTLKILFQPAEETLKGAVSVLDAGVLDDVDIAYGLHIRPQQDIPAGTMCAAVRHTSSAFVRINVKGQGAHASRPHLGVNCAEAAALITNAVCAIKMNPAMTWSAKVTSIKASAAAFNIIPESAEIVMDCRAQTTPLMEEMLEKIKTAASCAAQSVGATAEAAPVADVLPAADYDDELTAEIADEIVKQVGAENLARDCGGGGEDFHFYRYKRPHIRCAYFGVGVGAAPGLHDRGMTFDPKYLINGVKVLVGIALRKIG